MALPSERYRESFAASARADELVVVVGNLRQQLETSQREIDLLQSIIAALVSHAGRMACSQPVEMH